MGLWLIDADTLARSRFVLSTLSETVSCLITLERGDATHPGEQVWLAAHRPAYQQLMAADPLTHQLVRAALRPRWLADFFTPVPPSAGGLSFDEELAVVRATPPQEAIECLRVSMDGRLPPALVRDDLPARTAALMEWVWTETVLPYWPRRRRLLEADVLSRTRQLTTGGWAAALDGMRPGMRWLGDGRLRINAQDYPPREVSGAELLFVPTSGRGGWVAWDEDERRFAAVYPYTGALSEPDRTPAPQALARLLGPGRATVLVLLAAPRSTTQLVALTDQGLGSVGRHLKVLLDAGLVGRRRAGRSVLYFRTEAGDAVVGAQASVVEDSQPVRDGRGLPPA
ncbi:ArsR/SmtB family transcription factor [Streptomyces beijiangensis]|uniref:Helix-turn-helix transcriptional regulator n=1 Tax=Streptomyces beijiangensis TaxID=163361 RepID=A0A939JG24_9ACTN|nr:helix-turn-helix domain-containing protein [Streptomyces beijiangensis]MBO0514741.1 helix-turn-helix transcriptional regulator [Streptomyces beijiangensis]